MSRASRGSARGPVLWLGSLGYLLYQAVMFCFATPLNNLFLIYVAYLRLAVWSIVVLLRVTDLAGYGAWLSPRLPVRFVAGFALAVAALNASAWLAQIVPATLSSEPTAVLGDTGLLTNPVFVQDLASWLAPADHGRDRGLAPRGLGPAGHRGDAGDVRAGEHQHRGADQWFGSHADPLSNAPLGLSNGEAEPA